MTVDQILQRYARFGVDLGLDRVQQLLVRLGNPHTKVPIIHVAGTNGKGSVCAFLSNILEVAGYRTGRYTSPHLVNWRERICIDQNWISLEDFRQALCQVEAVITDNLAPTQFEVVTAAAWWYFASQTVDVAVIETGLGGRLDATNVCQKPLVSVITSISRDHWQRLGDSLAAIATEKAGILKAGCPVVVGVLPEEAHQVIATHARSLHCPITWVEPAQVWGDRLMWQGIEFSMQLAGKHQLNNSALALATADLLAKQGWQIPRAALAQGIAQTQWPGRLQWLTYRSRRILIDGAHNMAGAEMLRLYIDEQFFCQSCCWIIGILATKDYFQILQCLLRAGDILITVPIAGHEGVPPELLAQFAPPLVRTYITANIREALERALQLPELPTIVAGSLYLIGEFLSNLDLDVD